jgi:16S rRNA (guanine1207-N2)-methyltransferase
MPPTVITPHLRDFDLRLTTAPGVFSHREVDTGSMLLIDVMRVSPTARVLDLGCGYGVIGIVAAKLAVRGHVVLVDPDIRATRLAEHNLKANAIENAEVVLGDGFHDLPPKSRYDVVVSNPPTHQGREVLDEMVDGAYKALRPRGQLYMVVNRLLSLRRKIDEVFGNTEIAAREGGFIVIRAVKLPRTHASDTDYDA